MVKILSIAVCDDEVIFANKLKKIITIYMDTHQIDFEIDLYDSGVSFTNLNIEMSKYQIIFLDINMDRLDGIQTATKIREYCKDSFIVFVTAYVEYSIEGYKVEAIRYILKNNPQLVQAVNESLDTICTKLNYTAEFQTFEFKEGIKKLSLDRIAYIETEIHTLVFHVLEQDYVCYHYRDTLSNVAEQLKGYGFWRIHQSYLVNRKYITKLSSYNAHMVNEEVLPIAKQRFHNIKEQFVAYKGEM